MDSDCSQHCPHRYSRKCQSNRCDCLYDSKKFKCIIRGFKPESESEVQSFSVFSLNEKNIIEMRHNQILYKSISRIIYITIIFRRSISPLFQKQRLCKSPVLIRTYSCLFLINPVMSLSGNLQYSPRLCAHDLSPWLLSMFRITKQR